MGMFDLLSGRKILEEVDSPFNGKLVVVYEIGWGKVIWGGGLPQSGGLARKIWEEPLREVQRSKAKVQNCLILGFGGGGIAHIVHEQWPSVDITGVDIDKHMVKLGRKHLGWEKTKAKVFIADASDFVADCMKLQRNKSYKPIYHLPSTKFDLICIDMYQGQEVPKKFNTKPFIQKIKKLKSKEGVVIFNRLYGASNEKQAHDFKKKLDTVFSNIHTVFPSANVMYICY